MSQEHRDLVDDGDAAFLGLFPCGGDAHDDVAEDVPRELAELTLVHREREHVGGFVFVTIDFVQLMDAFVVG